MGAAAAAVVMTADPPGHAPPRDTGQLQAQPAVKPLHLTERVASQRLVHDVVEAGWIGGGQGRQRPIHLGGPEVEPTLAQRDQVDPVAGGVAEHGRQAAPTGQGHRRIAVGPYHHRLRHLGQQCL
jgi:hypothetical protein